ncbi:MULTISPECIES: GGDEF domain-containing protein [Methylomicrobium]|uniref:diguanylate cyclase n=1 Tax=Methylomicrobium album BG8 TaxID=686340 RepID=H8GNF0_METAL|nr:MULTISPECIES: GGDEF domain-containing protein [Methylomicrobium]EIC29543.1 diguanylate cyclase (GGDEF) domain-containing protein [Methylomicrobium album BG8]
MNQKSAVLTVTSTSTFESAKAVNLDHFDLSSALQTTLDFNKLISIFSRKIERLIPHTAYAYSHTEFGVEIKNGVFTRNAYTYLLKLEEQMLGKLTFMNNRKYSQKEIKLLENLLCFLIYPLKNATQYQHALKMAYTDPLTQANTRTSFDDSVKREMSLAIRAGKNLSVIFLDIDHFKFFNDHYGHQCGDFVLASLAKCIRDSLRSSDLLFRTGGEEFVILLSDTDIDGAKLLAERIRMSIENHTLVFDMHAIKVTVSLGVSALCKEDTAETFIKRADAAMYQAKRDGRNRVFVAA